MMVEELKARYPDYDIVWGDAILRVTDPATDKWVEVTRSPEYGSINESDACLMVSAIVEGWGKEDTDGT